MPAGTVAAYAKINLALYVLAKRNDGYHEIATLMQAIDLHDLIHFEPSQARTVLTCDEPGLSVGDDNLVLRAVRSLEEHCGRELPLLIHLQKRIPTGAGLGGGSSDAAATLWAVNGLLGLGVSRETLHRLASRLGSDVPFFLSSGQALAEGRGEQLTELKWPADFYAVVIFPEVFVSASEGYAAARISLTNPLAQHKIRRSLGPENFWNWLRSQSNDLAPGVIANHPEVAACLDALYQVGACYAAMSGSGSAVFGLFREFVPDEVLKTLASANAWPVFRARPVRSDRGPLPALAKGN